MKQTTFATGLVVACWITAAAAAQRTAAPTEQPAHNVFVLTGCFEQGKDTSAFRLTGASSVGQAPPRPGASAATKTQNEGVYELQAASVSEAGLSREKLQTEVGAKVEVTIRPVEATSPAPSRPASTDAIEKPIESPPQRYTVIKIDRLANSCA
jgi:hypothetical protein